MNLFYLDHDVKKAAKYHCDKHIVKMPTETVQILSFCWWDLHHKKLLQENEINLSLLYNDSKSYRRHPCVLWCSSNPHNYIWTCNFAEELFKEYTTRYGRIHKAEQKYKDSKLYKVPSYLYTLKHKVRKDDNPLCMPEYCKIVKDPVQSYRNYYIQEKSYFAKWNKTEKPHWYDK